MYRDRYPREDRERRYAEDEREMRWNRDYSGYGRPGFAPPEYRSMDRREHEHWGPERHWPVSRERAHEPDYPTQFGHRRSDERIREEVCERLYRERNLEPRAIYVDVSDGLVTLEGRVDSRPIKRLAEDVAMSVPGVEDVINHLRLTRYGTHYDPPGDWGGRDPRHSRAMRRG